MTRMTKTTTTTKTKTRTGSIPAVVGIFCFISGPGRGVVSFSSTKGVVATVTSGNLIISISKIFWGRNECGKKKLTSHIFWLKNKAQKNTTMRAFPPLFLKNTTLNGVLKILFTPNFWPLLYLTGTRKTKIIYPMNQIDQQTQKPTFRNLLKYAFQLCFTLDIGFYALSVFLSFETINPPFQIFSLSLDKKQQLLLRTTTVF